MLLGVAVVLASAPLARGAQQPTVFASQSTRAFPNWKPGEAGVAVNPRNANNIVVAVTEASDVWSGTAKQEMPDVRTEDWRQGFFMRCGLSVSYDGGKSWLYRDARDVIFQDAPPSSGGCIDPVVDFGPNGRVYFLAVCWPQRPGDGPAICVASSNDGGTTWGARVPVSGMPGDAVYTALKGEQPSPSSGAFDRPFISVDPNTGTVTVNAVNRTGDIAGTPRYLMVSHDEGQTFSIPRESPIAATQSAAHGLVSTYADGQLWITNDDGKTWKGTPGPAGVSSGQVAADPSEVARYAVLATAPTEAGGQFEQVYVTTDSGATWSSPTNLGDPAKAKFFSWIRFGSDGTLGAMWHEQHADGKDDVVATSSSDGGKTWGPSLAINPVTSLGGSMKPGDDCTCGMDVRAGAVHVVWTQIGPPNDPAEVVLPSRVQEVWYGRYDAG